MSERTVDIAREIAEASTPSRTYFIMTGLATVLASYGLLANSPAVVIGAMLVAMLLNPITGLSYALATADTTLVRRAALTEAMGVSTVYLIALVVGIVHRDLPITQEMVNRSDPTLLDLVIATAGGALVAYATGQARLNPALVGVAIATSLVPPLAASAMFLVHGEVRLSLGALVLFASNYAAILFSAGTIFWITGNRPKQRAASDPHVGWMRMFQVALFIALGAHLTIRLQQQIEDRTRAIAIQQALHASLDAVPGARLIEVRIAPSVAPDRIVATVRAPHVVTPSDVARLERALPASDARGLRLRVRSVPVTVTEAQGYLFTEAEP